MPELQPRNLFRADLHVHSRYSGRAKHLRFLGCRDCYSDPLEAYRTAKRRGMDLVTITDHDSLDGCLCLLDQLGDLPDFITGEEVSTFLPEFRHTIHIGVYGLNEGQHREIQRLRSNGAELIAYLRQSGLLFVLNHLFHDYQQPTRLREYIERMSEWFDIFEVRNGTFQREHNTLILSLLERLPNGHASARRLGMVGGSDSHTLRRIGRCFTASPARNREEFLEDVRAGRAQVFGPHSNHLTIAAEIYGVILHYYSAVVSVGNREFPPLTRMTKVFLSLGTLPFLFVPYVLALRHTWLERSRVAGFSRLLEW